MKVATGLAMLCLFPLILGAGCTKRREYTEESETIEQTIESEPRIGGGAETSPQSTAPRQSGEEVEVETTKKSRVIRRETVP